MKKFISLLFIIHNSLFISPSSAQPWLNPSYLNISSLSDSSKRLNFYEIVNAYEAYEQQQQLINPKPNNTIPNGEEEENNIHGWAQFHRWQYFMEPRVFPSGDITLPSRNYENFKDYLSHEEQSRITKSLIFNTQTLIPNANWTPMGPNSMSASYGSGGLGRINFIRFHPTNTNTIWVGAPSGGLWKSTDGGTTWSSNTDILSVIGCSDIAIDPTNTNIMYLATGDGDAGDNSSIGVLKSTDGGTTWNPTGLIWTVDLGRKINKLLINSTNNNMILAATSEGIYRTLDAAATWTQINSDGFCDIEFKPGDPTVVYASTYNAGRFYKSTNSGASFTNITSGLPSNGVNRMEIGVSAASPNVVYALASDDGNNGFYGLYRSANSGTSFTTQSATPNLLGYEADGSDVGGQGWYGIAIAINPTNANEIFVGGVNQWHSTDGGVNWNCITHWYGDAGLPYVHADVHALEYLSGGNSLFSGNDGGIYRTNNGTTWTDLSTGLGIGQLYRLSTSATDSNLNLAGFQDNGTNLKDTGGWSNVMGGDGMECLIDYSNANIIYAEVYYGNISKSTDGGANFSEIVYSGGTGVDGDGNWVTPFVIHPTTPTTLLVGKDEVYRSTDGGTSWTQVSSFNSIGNVVALAYAPSNPSYIYVAKSDQFYVSTNGNTFTDRTGTLPVLQALITYIAVSSTDPQKVWVSFSGYSGADKVYASADAGQTWTNYSTGLPNLPVNCILYQNGSQDGLYVGTDVGAYCRSNAQSSWTSFFTGLPNVIVNELEIQYTAKKIRAATFGRGLWESNLAFSRVNFTADNTNICQGSSVSFTDITTVTPVSWNWSFPGGTPATSTQQNPVITYNTPGDFPVSLLINGNDSLSFNNYITVIGIPFTTSQTNVNCQNDSTGIATVTVPGDSDFYSFTENWEGVNTWTIVNGNQTNKWIVGTATSNGGTHAMYISNNNDTNLYTPTAASIVHFYKDFTFPANATNISFKFDWKSQGDFTMNDYMKVYLVPTTVTPVAGTMLTSPAFPGNFFFHTSYITQTYSSTLLDSNAGHTIRMVFTWKNNSTASGQPPAAVDNIMVSHNGSNYSYIWNTNPVQTASTATNLSPGNYTVSISDAQAGCTISSSFTIVQTNNSTPPIITQNGLALNSNSPTGNQWYDASLNPISGAINPTFIPSFGGTYYLTDTDINGCISPFSAPYQYYFVGLSSNETRKLKIYPNPNGGSFILSANLPNNKELSVTIYNTLGQIVYEKKTKVKGQFLLPINLEGKPDGIYLVKLQDSEGIITERVVVE